MHSAVSPALRRLFLLRSGSRPRRRRGWPWWPRWAEAPAYPAASTDRWGLQGPVSVWWRSRQSQGWTLWPRVCSSRSTSRSSSRGASPGGASPTGATLRGCHRAAAWASWASLTSSCPPWSRTAASAPATPAARHSVRLRMIGACRRSSFLLCYL